MSCPYFIKVAFTLQLYSNMDKSWMIMGKTPDGRLSRPYIEGVNAFINFARAVVDLSSNIPYLCIHCVNYYRQSPHIVRIHLLYRWIMQSYIFGIVMENLVY